VIQREIDDRISDLFVSGELGDGEGVRVDAADGAFVVASVPRATVEVPAAA
jgi:ATP-dependent Clp protease ATP-binding subunit ClpC